MFSIESKRKGKKKKICGYSSTAYCKEKLNIPFNQKYAFLQPSACKISKEISFSLKNI